MYYAFHLKVKTLTTQLQRKLKTEKQELKIGGERGSIGRAKQFLLY